jgi:hypothetical protein
MKASIIVFIAAMTVVGSTTAQEGPSLSELDPSLPRVTIDNRSATLQESLYPEYYRSHSLRRDMRWLTRHDSSLVSFWESNGPLILGTLSELSGLPWIEREIDIFLVRYYPTIGSADPLIIPVGGMRRGYLTEAAPRGSRMQLNLTFQLARRMLEQTVQPDRGYYHPMADHPLMQAEPYRRDNLAMLLALVTCERVIGLDSTYDAYRSAFWRQRHPGREVFETYLLKEWILSRERPLARWVLEEPVTSRLVSLTRRPRPARPAEGTRKREYVAGLPLVGRLGFSVNRDASGRMKVGEIDPARTAYACGLRENDIIRQVNGRRVRSHKDLIENILATFDVAGATVRVVRDDMEMTVLLQPIVFEFEGNDFDYYEEIESLPVPDTAGAGQPEDLGR